MGDETKLFLLITVDKAYTYLISKGEESKLPSNKVIQIYPKLLLGQPM